MPVAVEIKRAGAVHSSAEGDHDDRRSAGGIALNPGHAETGSY